MKHKKVETDVLNLSGQNINRIQIPLNQEATTIILDKNNISKVENLQKCLNLKQLSIAGNRIVRMNGVAGLKSLTVLNLPNNSIVSVEGLKDLSSLVWLNLSGNSIKAIENLGSNVHLRHLDMSDNSVSTLTDISHLHNLRTFLLHGNIITSLRTVPAFLPKSLCIFSLAENEILDLNEVAYLSCLPNLEQLSLMNNPCVLMTASTPGFDSRPYIVNWCMMLHVLDGYKVTEKERLKAEWLYSQGKGRHYKPGQHVELCQYLANTCPLTASAEIKQMTPRQSFLSKTRSCSQLSCSQLSRSHSLSSATRQLESQEDAKLSQILYKQKLHQQQLQSPRQQNSHLQSPVRLENSLLNNLSADSFASSGQISESSRAPPPPAQVAGWIHRSGSSEFYGTGSEIRATQCNDLTVIRATQCNDLTVQDVIQEEYETRSQTSLLESESVYLPVNTRPMTAPAVSSSSPASNFQHLLRRENRPVTSADNRYEAYDRKVVKPLNQDLSKSKPNFQVSPPQRSGNEPAVMTKRSTPPTAQAHDYDTSQEVSQIEEILTRPVEHVPEQEISSIKDKVERRTKKATVPLKRSSSNEKSRPQASSKRTPVKTVDSPGAKNSAIPVSRSTNLYRTQSDYIPGRYAHNARKSGDSVEKSDKSKPRTTRETRNSFRDSGFLSRPVSDAVLEEYTPQVKKDQKYYLDANAYEELMKEKVKERQRRRRKEHKAAVMIQTRWRGYWTRQHHPEAVSVRKEMRAKRAEDHIIILRVELDKQRKLYEEEKHQRVLQLEALRYLWKEVQSLQSWKNEVLNSQSFKSTARQDDSYSEEIQNTLQAMDTGRSSRHGNTVDMERHVELEKACASLQNQVAQLSQALQSVSSVVFQSSYFNSPMDTCNNTSLEGTIMVTGYDDDDDTSSCDENTETEVRWGTVPHSLSPYPSEEEESYFMSVPQPGFPTPPRNVKLEHKGTNSVVISWAPSKILDNMNRETNKPVLGYRVFVDETAVSMIAANMQKALLHGLDPKHTYKLYVRAVSALGESNMSNVIMAALSASSNNVIRKCSYTSDSDNNRSDDSEKEADLDSTESSDVTRYKIERQRRQKRIKSPRQDRRQTQRKESSASDQDPVREPEQSSKSSRPSSRSGSAADGIFVQPRLHTHRRSRSKDSTGQSPDSELKDQCDSSQRGQPKILQPSSSKQSPPAGSQQHRESSVMGSKLSETFTVETANSLMQAINAAQSQVQEGSDKERSVKSHRRTRSKDLSHHGSSESVQASENASVSSPKPSRQDSSGGRFSDNDNSKTEKTHRRTNSKDYEWRKNIDSSSHEKKGEGHGVPVIDARRRHNSGSRPSSPAPSDVSEKSLPDRKKTVAEFLEHRSSTKSIGQNSERSPTAGGSEYNDPTHTAALPPRHKKSNSSNEDISGVQDVRRSPSKNASPTYTERRRIPSNNSESDLSEIHSSSAARQLDMEKKTNSGIVSKLLQKLQTFSKSQEETLSQRGHKIKKKTELHNLNPEEGRRPRRTSGSDQDMSQDSKGVPQSDSSSGTQSDDPQMAKKPYQTHRRSRSDQRLQITPSTSTKSQPPQNYTEPQWVTDSTSQHDQCVQPNYSQPDSCVSVPEPATNVKRTASFHGVVQPKQPDVTPRRSGSEENLNEKSNVAQADPQFQQVPFQEMFAGGMFSRKQRQMISGNTSVHHIPILSGAQLQKSQKQLPS